MYFECVLFFFKLAVWGGVVFLYFFILIIVVYVFNIEDAVFSFLL